MKRRSNSEGTVYRRKDGRWTAQVRYIDPVTMHMHRQSLYGRTRKEALDKLQALQQRLKRGDAPRDARISVSDLMRTWLEDVAAPNVKPSVYRNYESVIANYLDPELGARSISTLRPAMIEHVLTGASAKGSARMRQIALQILRAALKAAVRWRLLAHNPAEDVAMPKTRKRPINPLSPEQVEAFLSAARGRRLYALYLTAIFSGAREGELLALRWRDVDLPHRRIRVHGSLDPATRELLDPKTARSRRTVTVSAAVCRELDAHRDRMMAEGNLGEHVFVSTVGTLLSARNVVRDFKEILETAGIDETVRFHDLRHTYATLALMAGVPLKVVSDQLGHASIQITADTYTHVLPSMHADAADALDRYYSQLVSGEAVKNGGQVALAP